MKNMEKLQRLPFKARKAVFEKLEQIVDIAAMSKEDRMKYDESIKVYRDQLVTMEYERRKGEAKERLKKCPWYESRRHCSRLDSTNYGASP